ncbi:hypothetical protein LTR17_011032 [Elasticomyces elasticus]|nr:hypothetical protein LTR17_011032 [Elasticomyces elasticus]
MAYNADGFVKNLRSRFPSGLCRPVAMSDIEAACTFGLTTLNKVFSLNFFGGRHNILYGPGLATALLNQKQHIANSEEVSRRLLNVIFGFPKSELHKYDEGLPDMMACYKHLLSEPSLSDLV